MPSLITRCRGDTAFFFIIAREGTFYKQETREYGEQELEREEETRGERMPFCKRTTLRDIRMETEF